MHNVMYTLYITKITVNIVSDIAYSISLSCFNVSNHLSSGVSDDFNFLWQCACPLADLYTLQIFVPPIPDKNNVVNMDWWVLVYFVIYASSKCNVMHNNYYCTIISCFNHPQHTLPQLYYIYLQRVNNPLVVQN